jgi:hypothetical protein
VGRPSALTPDVRELLERELAQGASVRVAAERSGVSESSAFAWIASGKVERRRAPAPAPVELVPPDGGELDVLERVRQAEPALVLSILRAAQKEGRWHAAAWLLERSRPEAWGRVTTRPAAGTSEPMSSPDDPFLELDELAAKRRKKRRSP